MNSGAIVRFRNRDWVLLRQEEEVVFLRPLIGTSDDLLGVHLPLANLVGYTFPSECLQPSRFPLPSAETVADAQSVHLLWQAARLLLREGATPFRSLGRISVRPRTYQLVPLLMALRLEPVRLLIADDVGVGKTIEAGLIVRELWERGEIRRLAVLCPPYLCDQWQKELLEKFHLDAVVLSPATLGRLERRTPPGRSIWQHYPVQVISVDFVKHERNKHTFLLHAPELVIVDEAHGVTPGQGQQHLRYALVHELAQEPKRHLLLLTATPHSGIREAFQRLLGLLDPKFEEWDFAQLTEPQRVRLARHFVQRTRRDIEARWEAEQCFPRREPLDATYSLSPAYRQLFDAVYSFCTEIVRSGEQLERHQRRMRWWGALALLRCVMSSPRAAIVALQKRRQVESTATPEPETEVESYSASIYEPTDHAATDEAPTPLLDRTQAHLSDPERHRLRELQRLAEAISEAEDAKLQGCLDIVRQLLQAGHNPVIWCFYIDTAEYVAEKLRQALAGEDVRVECLTGRVGEEERRLRVQQLLAESTRRVLVATDCLSEGINLQRGFTAVLHYDLPWNPNRLEQREGRVDRFEQPHPVVKVVRYYGRDNPVDGAVLRVLLDKAREIHQALGTHVPIPEDEAPVIEALVHALFFGRECPAPLQFELPFEEAEERVRALHRSWDLDARREKESRTRFAQHALKPDEVRRELEATDQVLGDPAAVRNFVLSACQRLGLQVRPSRRPPDGWEILTTQAALVKVPEVIRQTLPAVSSGRWTVAFTSPTPEGAEYLGRNHPFVGALARYLFEQAFAGAGEAIASRCGALRTRAVERLTALFLLRPRFEVVPPNRPSLLSEEVLVVGWQVFSERWFTPEEALALLAAEPSSNLSPAEKRELVARVLEEARPLLGEPASGPFLEVLQRRAEELAVAHRRIRQSAGQPIRGLQVKPHWPPDLLGVLVLQPEVQP
jgi:superfamily II DNA or RNA helicase